MTRCRAPDPDDPVCTDRPIEPAAPTLARGIDGLRIAVAGGYFKKGMFPEACAAMDRVAAALRANTDIEIPEAQRARAAAYVITASEGASLHLERLRTRANDFDPAMRDRLIAGAMIPAALVNRAQKFRRWYRGEVLKLFDTVDAILAPATPCTAPGDRAEDVRDRRRRTAGAAEYRHLHPADLVHRPAGRRRAGPARTDADRRAGHRRAVAGGHRAANRLRVGAGGCLLGAATEFSRRH